MSSTASPTPTRSRAPAAVAEGLAGGVPVRRRWRRTLVEGVGLALAAALAWWARAWLVGAVHALVGASPAWLLLAVAAEWVAMASLAREQRRLIGRGPAGPVRLRSVLATTYAGNTLAVALPLAGSSLSAAFTFRRYVAAGAPAGQVAAGLAVSWALSSATFTAVLALAAAGTGQTPLLVSGVVGGVASATALVGLLLALHSARVRDGLGRVVLRVLPTVQRLVHRPVGDPGQLVATAVAQVAATRLRRRDLMAATGSAVLLWVADVACLGCALQAVGASVALPELVLAWSAGIGVNTLSLTPGGLGLVEAALTAALMTAGLPATTALAGVLLYRLISFWLVGAVGAGLLARHHHRTVRAVRV